MIYHRQKYLLVRKLSEDSKVYKAHSLVRVEPTKTTYQLSDRRIRTSSYVLTKQSNRRRQKRETLWSKNIWIRSWLNYLQIVIHWTLMKHPERALTEPKPMSPTQLRSKCQIHSVSNLLWNLFGRHIKSSSIKHTKRYHPGSTLRNTFIKCQPFSFPWQNYTSSTYC